MSTAAFSKRQAIGFGWETAKRHVGFFAVAFILAAVANGIPGRIQAATEGTDPFMSALFGLIGLVVGQVVAIGFTRISLRFADHEPAALADLYAHYRLFFKFLFASILYGLIVAVGLILLIVPGIMWAVRYGLCGYLVVDRGLGPLEALGKSAEITRGERWNLFLLALLLMGVVVLGALALVIGLLWAVPTAMVAAAYAYRRVLARAEAAAPVSAPPAPAA